MNGKNPEVNARAYRRALAKTVKCKELGITPDLTDDQQDDLVKFLAEKKCKTEGKGTWQDYVKGQRWYLGDLMAFSALESAQDRLDYEYAQAFPDIAEESELLNSLESVMNPMVTQVVA